MSKGAILAIDTAFGPIGVALCSHSGEPIASETVPDALGSQAEKLPPLVAQMFAKTGIAPSELGGIAVTVGPGAFTGVRVGLAFAKGLGLALKIPLLGFTTLQCLAVQARAMRAQADTYASIIDARRGEFYAQGFDGALNPVFGPDVMSGDDLAAELVRLPGSRILVGSGAIMIADKVGSGAMEALTMDTIDARLLASMACDAELKAHPPVPCYLRPADARLPS